MNQTLFPSELIFPEGFTYLENFITEAEEAELLRLVETVPLHSFIFQGFEAKRKVASFGYDYSFDSRNLKKGTDIPHEFDHLVDKVATTAGVPKATIAELLVTEYPPGAVINWHRDAPPFELVAGISLLSDCTFKLRPHDKLKPSRRNALSFTVRRRSLYIMRGIARSDWQHSIAPVSSTRFSITVRTLK